MHGKDAGFLGFCSLRNLMPFVLKDRSLLEKFQTFHVMYFNDRRTEFLFVLSEHIYGNLCSRMSGNRGTLIRMLSQVCM